MGLNPDEVRIYLVNAQARLFSEGPPKLGRILEKNLSESGVTVLYNRKALQEKDGTVYLDHGENLDVGLCIWTIGLIPNPALRSLGVPLTSNGRIVVDKSYRIQGFASAYSIGDCARIIDPRTNKEDRMTCKEGGMQVFRLGQIFKADLAGRLAPIHKSMTDMFAIGLGENCGLVWVRKWGINSILSGKLVWKMKKIAWNGASMLRQ